MSASRPSGAAIAATTATLFGLLDRELRRVLPGVKVNACPPDQVRHEAGGKQINLFLFQVLEDARQRPTVRQISAGVGPLALCLRYLLTAYGEDGDGFDTAHQVLGESMRILHDNAVIPVIGEGESRGPALHVALQPMSIDELNKLWASWQCPYRISVIYEVSPVILSSPDE